MYIEKVTINLSELQTIARTECLLLWDRMITDKCFNKNKIIKTLHSEGKLTYDDYEFYCPFCHYLRFTTKNKFKHECENCLWPYDKKLDIEPQMRCLNSHSPFNKFCDAIEMNDNENALKYAKQVFELLENTEIKESNKKIIAFIGDDGEDDEKFNNTRF